jgi:hypothetical protein
MHYSN